MSFSSILESDRRWMKAALKQAERAFDQGEVPVGAVIVRGGEIVGRGHNLVERLKDPTAHAEVIAITAACETLGSKTLQGCSLFVTLEPCPMCAGAIVLARLDRLVFGAFDEKAGAASTIYNIPQDARLNHRVEIISGLEQDAAASLLHAFFQQRRLETPEHPANGRSRSPGSA
jgi:tRNA(adenine34) deaminase